MGRESEHAVCAVVAARNEAGRIRHVLGQLMRAGVGACIVINNGSQDETAALARATALMWAATGRTLRVLEVAEPLGPDVGRAYGAYVGLRDFPRAAAYVFVDGDWGGGFGPQLAAFLQAARESGAWVAYADSRHRPLRTDARIYRDLAHRFAPHLQGAAVPELPLFIRREAFTRVSPWWLHQPGLFFAHCLRQGVPMAVVPRLVFNVRIRGDKTRGAAHQARMRETLLGDAVEAARFLLARPPGRHWRGRSHVGLASTRRLDVLARLAATAEIRMTR
ncbi:hypothetical protein [Alicyclobacillus herbarius]|uniref:hypothetical protein n=1 Tax=Alicyclobacillus herbarius TaxID=122960 RepID=UPI00041F48E2|nr:hypothetical protein [Alicyclobacillus herbarius]